MSLASMRTRVARLEGLLAAVGKANRVSVSRSKPHIRLYPERKQLRWACFRPNGVAYFGSTPTDAYRRAFPPGPAVGMLQRY